MRASRKTVVRETYGFRCGYCGVSENEVGAQLTLDHFQPRAQNGSDETSNLVYCCHACNEFKGDFWQPKSKRRVLHPLRDNLSKHVTQDEDGALRGLTPTGVFHIERLRLNRPALLSLRQERGRLQKAREEQAALLKRLAQLEQQIQHLTTRIENLEDET